MRADFFRQTEKFSIYFIPTEALDLFFYNITLSAM
jgi:hypothetical protein